MNRLNFESFLSHFEKLRTENTPFCIVTLIQIQGSAPQEVGSRMIITPQGLVFGTVGGGILEARAIELAKAELLEPSRPASFFEQWNLQRDLGMSCGGVVGLFFEKHFPLPQWEIAVFGAGHVSQELVRVLLRLECKLTCVDPRREWLDRLPQDPRLKIIHTEDMPSILRTLPPQTYLTVVTMGHKTDLPIVREALLHHQFPYLGVIGSEVKASTLRARLREAEVPEDKIASIYCPIGEDIGDNSPAEIALSIAAQLLRKRKHK